MKRNSREVTFPRPPRKKLYTAANLGRVRAYTRLDWKGDFFSTILVTRNIVTFF